MFERFSTAARQAVSIAQREAADRGETNVDVIHLLFGLVSAAGAARFVLEEAGITRTQLPPTARSLPVEPRGDASPPPFSSTTKQILRTAWDNAESRNSTSGAVGTIDLLLALLQHSEAARRIPALPSRLEDLLASAHDARPMPEDLDLVERRDASPARRIATKVDRELRYR